MIWHVEIRHGDWILSGHGPRHLKEPRFACRITPTPTLICSDMSSLFPTSQGEVIYEKVTGWGWRFRGWSQLDSTKWRLRETKENCIEDARQLMEWEEEVEPHRGQVYRAALGDIREYNGVYL